MLRKAPVKQRNVGRPNMWVTGGRRSNTGFTVGIINLSFTKVWDLACR